MAVTKLTDVRPRADHRTALSSLSAADRAAHDAASHVRPVFSPAGEEALRRAYDATERIRREEYDKALNARGLDEYHEYVASVAA